MKKIFAILLFCFIITASLAFGASAVSLKDGTSALNAQFEDWKCYSETDGTLLTDAVFYSPAQGKSDTRQYPLFVWIHGMTSGRQERMQLNYCLSNFSSEEYQNRYGDGGFFVFAPRALNGGDWNPEYVDTLMHIINVFITEKSKNIDTTRIYIGGYSTGGAMVWDLLESYPKVFTAALVAAPASEPTDLSDVAISRICNIPIWIFSCDRDPRPFAKTQDVKEIFDSLVRLSDNPAKLRMTNFTEATYANGTKRGGWDEEHFIWECITFDMHMIDGVTPFLYGTTVDGQGNVITFEDPENGIISWLKQQKPDENRDTTPAEKGLWDRFVDFLVIVYSIFKALWNTFFA